MNQWKGSLYLMLLSYKREFSIFWLINSTFLLNIVICYMFPDISLITIGLASTYIFSFILSTKLLNKTLAVSLRYGLNRKRYLGTAAMFIFIWSFCHAAMILLMNIIMLWSADFWGLSNLVVPRISMLFDENVSLFINLVIDICAISLLSMTGILINILFYRFGLIGGYGFMGLVGIILIIGLPLKWYSNLFSVVIELNIAQFCGSILLLSAIIYGIVSLLVNKLSAISAHV